MLGERKNKNNLLKNKSMSEQNFSPEMEAKIDREKVKPFLKKVECRVDFACRCGCKIKKGEMVNLVLTQADIDEQLKVDPKSMPIPDRMCDDCLDAKLVRESKEREKKEN